ncbi:DUF4019 domain-containing protein [Massilia sp. ST3]|uniref:DUF4019 domain-containing protein n=1 Tax=Massilia sp. ST3 TaxID=2824903 RepID=UPI001B81FBBC|nr:DUF4019 domain-containing protein [Massilia sp. ST3]
MKPILSAILALSFLGCGAAAAQDARGGAAAPAAAEKWLKLVDAGDYAGAWNTSSADVRANHSKFFWTTLIGGVRLPLGEARSRSLKSAVPKAEGSRVALEYASRFEKDKQARETVTAARDKDGAWRVTGYSIDATTDR